MFKKGDLVRVLTMDEICEKYTPKCYDEHNTWFMLNLDQEYFVWSKAMAEKYGGSIQTVRREVTDNDDGYLYYELEGNEFTWDARILELYKRPFTITDDELEALLT